MILHLLCRSVLSTPGLVLLLPKVFPGMGPLTWDNTAKREMIQNPALPVSVLYFCVYCGSYKLRDYLAIAEGFTKGN